MNSPSPVATATFATLRPTKASAGAATDQFVAKIAIAKGVSGEAKKAKRLTATDEETLRAWLMLEDDPNIRMNIALSCIRDDNYLEECVNFAKEVIPNVSS
jgi:hypothetical protein